MNGQAKSESVDIAIIGAGAAGLMAAISAGRRARELGLDLKIVAIDGAKKIGAKILVAGGGRCNVTHHAITEREYAGGSSNAVRNVLRTFGVADTVRFFADLGVELKREDTGKLFPTTDRAQTVLDALLGAVRDAGAEVRHPQRVEAVRRDGDGFVISGDWGELVATRVILAAGGKALPRTGSDGHGYSLAKALGHTTTDHIFPALVPLKLDASSPLLAISGVAAPATLELRAGTGKRLKSFTNATLCTHFGLSGPGPMDISRYLTEARLSDPRASLVVRWLPDVDQAEVDRDLQALGKRSIGRYLAERLPARLAETLCEAAGVDPKTPGVDLRKDARRGLLIQLFEAPLPVIGDRGYTHAEVTAGGVPLDQVDIKTMASRRCEGLSLCGEILDVDGRIGGFNFQWAWATGHIAGRAAVASVINTERV